MSKVKSIPKEQLVCQSKCDQCLFSSNRIVTKERMKQIIANTLKANTHFICHKGSINKQNIACAGWAERYGSTWLTLAKQLNLIKYVTHENHNKETNPRNNQL